MVTADLVLVNGKICTVDRTFSFHEAVAVRGGWIIDVGSTEEIGAYIGAGTEVIDLGGRLVLPGAHDEHTHAAFAGFCAGPDFINVSGCKTERELAARLAAEAARVPAGTWLIGGNLGRGAIFGKGLPNSRALDEAVPGHPVMLTDTGLHGMLINRRAMELCGLTREVPDPDPANGKLFRYEDGNPTGFVHQYVLQTMIGRHAPRCGERAMEENIRRVQRQMNRDGVTTHTDMTGIGGDYLFCGTWGTPAVEAYERLARIGGLTARCAINVLAGYGGEQSCDAIAKGLDEMKLPAFQDENWVNARALKIFGDLGWKRPHECKDGNLGVLSFPGATDEEQIDNITRALIEAHRRGWQMGIHLTGGRGIDTVIDAYVQAERLYPGRDLRHFVIHGDELTEDNIQKCVKYKIGLSSQAVAPYGFMEGLVSGLDPAVGERMFDYQDYINKGMVVAQGSDAPCMTTNWRKGLQFCMTRTTQSGTVYRRDLGCTLRDGIRMYTIFGAWQNHMEDVCGSIEVNKLADFQVLGEDLFAVTPDELGDVPVVMTICGGKVVYQA